MTDSVRIDKWLWAARFFKTRTLATSAVDDGKVKLGGERVKPARSIKVGEVLAIDNGADEWEVQVVALSAVRASAAIAQRLYLESEASVRRRALQQERRRLFPEPSAALKGRPTKRDRRLIDKFS